MLVGNPGGRVIPPELFVGEGMIVETGNAVAVAVSIPGGVSVGTVDGVADSAANESGIAEPTIGTEIKNVRALAETIVNGSIGRIGRIGS